MITAEDIQSAIKAFKENITEINYPTHFICDKWTYIEQFRFPKKKRRWYKRVMRKAIND